ncbi:MAG: hypothetical protein J6W75_05250 [Bacteroidaceae bacterium]|nr:hypothetical protein [Bacteroidaceae bacterium]
MKKIYLTPALQVAKVQVASMLAESLLFDGSKTVNGEAALINDNPWNDIWGEAEE